MKKILVVEDEYYARKSIDQNLTRKRIWTFRFVRMQQRNEGHRITRRI